MATYALIDINSGFVWGVVMADDPLTACRMVDEDCREYDRTYVDIGREHFDGRDGYQVHAAPDGFEVDDGQDPATIDRVDAMPFVTNILTKLESS